MVVVAVLVVLLLVVLLLGDHTMGGGGAVDTQHETMNPHAHVITHSFLGQANG